MTITQIPEGLESLRATACGECHQLIYREWAESMHAKAWTDPYYQIDKTFDGEQQLCLNCHIEHPIFLVNYKPGIATIHT